METIQVSGITVTNDTDIRGQAIRDLIRLYIPGFSGCYYGYRSEGDNDIDYPAIFVEPAGQEAQMRTTGKYQIQWSYNLFLFVRDNDPLNITTLVSSGIESLVKLFSNNAFGNLDNRFKAYDGYWIDSTMNSIEISRAYVNATPGNQARYMRAAMMRLTVMDQIVK